MNDLTYVILSWIFVSNYGSCMAEAGNGPFPYVFATRLGSQMLFHISNIWMASSFDERCESSQFPGQKCTKHYTNEWIENFYLTETWYLTCLFRFADVEKVAWQISHENVVGAECCRLSWERRFCRDANLRLHPLYLHSTLKANGDGLDFLGLHLFRDVEDTNKSSIEIRLCFSSITMTCFRKMLYKRGFVINILINVWVLFSSSQQVVN